MTNVVDCLQLAVSLSWLALDVCLTTLWTISIIASVWFRVKKSSISNEAIDKLKTVMEAASESCLPYRTWRGSVQSQPTLNRTDHAMSRLSTSIMSFDLLQNIRIIFHGHAQLLEGRETGNSYIEYGIYEVGNMNDSSARNVYELSCDISRHLAEYDWHMYLGNGKGSKSSSSN